MLKNLNICKQDENDFRHPRTYSKTVTSIQLNGCDITCQIWVFVNIKMQITDYVLKSIIYVDKITPPVWWWNNASVK